MHGVEPRTPHDAHVRIQDFDVNEMIRPLTEQQDKVIVEHLFLFTELLIQWREEVRHAKHRNMIMSKLAARKATSTHVYSDISPGHHICYQGDTYVMVARKPPAGEGDPVTAVIRKCSKLTSEDTTPFEVKWSQIQPLASIMPMLTLPRQHDIDIDSHVFVQYEHDAILLGKTMTLPDSDGQFTIHVYIKVPG